jgi:hypothetical protein
MVTKKRVIRKKVKGFIIPKSVRFGIVLFCLGLVFVLMNDSIKSNLFTDLLFVILFFGGIIMMNYGLTKIKVRGNEKFQKFLREYNLFTFIFMLAVLVLALLSFLISFSSVWVIILLILFAIVFIIDAVLTWIFYVKTWKYFKE